MTYNFCLPYRRGAVTPPIMFMIPATHQSFYINKNVPTNGNGFSIETPWQTFGDYQSYAMTNNLRNLVVLNINDADYYENAIIEDISALSENLCVNAPYATFNDIRFDYTGQVPNTFLEKSCVVAGHIRGNVVLSRESFLICTGEAGTGGNGAAVPSGTAAASTTITLDQRNDVNDVYLDLNVFRGSIDFTTNHNADVHLNINDWEDASLVAALGTLPDAQNGERNQVIIAGDVEGKTFPRPHLILEHDTGLPSRITSIAGSEANPMHFPTGDLRITLLTNDVFNVKSVTELHLAVSDQSGTRIAFVTVSATNFTKNDNQIGFSANIANASFLDALNTSNVNTFPIEVGAEVEFLYDNGRTNVRRTIYFHTIQRIPNA